MDNTTPTSTPTEYVFPNYWGGATRSPNPPLIHSKIHDLRMEIGGLAAKKQQGGPMFPVRSAKELTLKLAQALHNLDMVAPVIAQEVNLVDTKDIPGNVSGSGKPVFRTLAHVKATVRLAAADGSYVDMVGSGHGGDVDDKAGGKATTYAWKDAVLKGLTIGEQDMVDTDDEEPSKLDDAPAKGSRAVRGTSPKLPSGEDGADAGNHVGESKEGFDYVARKIAEAKSELDLDAIQSGIRSGTLALAGSDRLKASQLWVMRKKQIQADSASV